MNIKTFLTWDNAQYRDFMITMLKSLEPIFYKKNTKIYTELEEYGEVNFIQKGEIQIGFEINKVEIYPLKYINKCVIGGYGITFKQRSNFIYKAATRCEGFFIRRENWHNILESQS